MREQGLCMLHIIFQSLHVFPIMTTHWKYVPTKHILNVFIQNSVCFPLRCFLYIAQLKIGLPVLILSVWDLLLLFIVSRFPLWLSYTLLFTGMESVQTWILRINICMRLSPKDIYGLSHFGPFNSNDGAWRSTSLLLSVYWETTAYKSSMYQKVVRLLMITNVCCHHIEHILTLNIFLKV